MSFKKIFFLCIGIIFRSPIVVQPYIRDYDIINKIECTQLYDTFTQVLANELKEK